MGNIFEPNISDMIRQLSYRMYQKDKSLTVEAIYDRLNSGTVGVSGLNMKELCEKGGVPDKEIKRAILEGIKTSSIDNLE